MFLLKNFCQTLFIRFYSLIMSIRMMYPIEHHLCFLHFPSFFLIRHVPRSSISDQSDIFWDYSGLVVRVLPSSAKFCHNPNIFIKTSLGGFQRRIGGEQEDRQKVDEIGGLPVCSGITPTRAGSLGNRELVSGSSFPWELGKTTKDC